MARSVLGSFISGTRQTLAVQLFVSVATVGVAGWTLGVTNDLMRERAALTERVIQLEQELAQRNIRVPEAPTRVDRAETAPPDYPPGATLPEEQTTGTQAEDTATRDPTGRAEEPPAPEPAPGGADSADAGRAPTTDGQTFDPGRILGELFTPAPPLRTIVLHVRAEGDAAIARRIAADLGQRLNARVAVLVMPPRDQRQSGYAYFDGRQSRAAASVVQQFNDVARGMDVAPWSAQLRGIALPAQGEYTPDRLDIVLPPRPEPQRVDPRAVQNRVTQPQPQIEPPR